MGGHSIVKEYVTKHNVYASMNLFADLKANLRVVVTREASGWLE